MAASGGGGGERAWVLIIIAVITSCGTLGAAVLANPNFPFFQRPTPAVAASTIPTNPTSDIIPTWEVPTLEPPTREVPTVGLPTEETITFSVAQCVSDVYLIVKADVYIDTIYIGTLSNDISIDAYEIDAYDFYEGTHTYYINFWYWYYNSFTGGYDPVTSFYASDQLYFAQGNVLNICHSGPNVLPSITLN